MGNADALAAGHDRTRLQRWCCQESQPAVGNPHRRVGGGAQHHIVAPGDHPDERHRARQPGHHIAAHRHGEFHPAVAGTTLTFGGSKRVDHTGVARQHQTHTNDKRHEHDCDRGLR